MYSTVKYTDDTRDSRKEKLEWKIRSRRDTIGYNMPPYSLDLAPFDFAFFPQLKSDLHGERLSNLEELRTESVRLVISTEIGFNDIGYAYNTRESIFRNCAVHRIDDVILL